MPFVSSGINVRRSFKIILLYCIRHSQFTLYKSIFNKFFVFFCPISGIDFTNAWTLSLYLQLVPALTKAFSINGFTAFNIPVMMAQSLIMGWIMLVMTEYFITVLRFKDIFFNVSAIPAISHLLCSLSSERLTKLIGPLNDLITLLHCSCAWS